MHEKGTKAIVQAIERGKHGRYVVATSKEVEGSITFALDPSVWQEQDEPTGGAIVILSDLRKKRAGWRAMRGRYLRPDDQ